MHEWLNWTEVPLKYEIECIYYIYIFFYMLHLMNTWASFNEYMGLMWILKVCPSFQGRTLNTPNTENIMKTILSKQPQEHLIWVTWNKLRLIFSQYVHKSALRSLLVWAPLGVWLLFKGFSYDTLPSLCVTPVCRLSIISVKHYGLHSHSTAHKKTHLLNG